MGAVTERFAGTYRRVRTLDPALLLLAAMVFIVQLGVAVMLPLLPLYAQSLGATPTVLGLLTSVFAVTNGLGQLVTGFLAERFAMRRLLAAGIGAYAAANFLIATASSAGLLVAFRGAAGLGGGVMLVGERLYLAQLVEPGRLAFANGVLSAAQSAGSVAGPAFGGLLAAMGDLRLPFLLVGVTSLLGTLGALFLPRPPQRTGREGEVVGEPAASGSSPADAATGAPTATAAPASDRHRLLVLLFAQMALMAAFGAFITTYAPFAEAELGWQTAEIGAVFALFGLGAITLGPWLGRQADLRGRRNIAILGLLPVLAFSTVYWLELERPLLYLAAVCAGAGITGFNAAWYALLADATGGGRRSRRFGTVAAFGNLGIIVGATAASQLWEGLGDVSVGFVVAGSAVIIGGLVMLALPADRPRMLRQ
jgi:MFS transporter, DHA1 family, multidrug resistance protein